MDEDLRIANEIVNSCDNKSNYDYSSCSDSDILLGREIAGCCNNSSGKSSFNYSNCTDNDILIGQSIAGTLKPDNRADFSSFDLLFDDSSKKGLYDWFEIFKSGSHTSNTGITKTYTNEDLDKIVSSTKSSSNNVPLVVGHVIINHPVYGYLADLKREGSSLYAKCKDIVPQFEEFVKTSCKGISASINPDMSLYHIAFLAVETPAISLESINFNESM